MLFSSIFYPSSIKSNIVKIESTAYFIDGYMKLNINVLYISGLHQLKTGADH